MQQRLMLFRLRLRLCLLLRALAAKKIQVLQRPQEQQRSVLQQGRSRQQGQECWAWLPLQTMAPLWSLGGK